MIQLIGSPFATGGASKPGSTGVLESRLIRYETQLADWCNCPGGKTPEGKEKIADLQQKAAALKEEIGKIEAARSGQRVAASAASVPRVPQGFTRSTSDSAVDVYV
jgi:hypothetical protein